jgi:hypothetical protein
MLLRIHRFFVDCISISTIFNFTTMTKSLIVVLMLISFKSIGQSFSFADLENFYSKVSDNSREVTLSQKGFFLENKIAEGKHTVMLFRKGERESLEVPVATEDLRFVLGKSKHIVYATTNSEYYLMLQRQINQTCKFVNEKQSAAGDITQIFKKGDATVMVTNSLTQGNKGEKLPVYNVIIINL